LSGTTIYKSSGIGQLLMVCSEPVTVVQIKVINNMKRLNRVFFIVVSLLVEGGDF
jgi:hypothetical protein